MPMRVLSGKPPAPWLIIHRPEIVGPGLPVKILPAVAEGVDVGIRREQLAAEGIIGVVLRDRAGPFCSGERRSATLPPLTWSSQRMNR